MSDWHSERFQKRVHLTHHAALRMQERRFSLENVQDLIETGAVKRKDDRHWWIYKSYPDRGDNLVCAAVVAGSAIIIKTLMTHWQEQPE